MDWFLNCEVHTKCSSLSNSLEEVFSMSNFVLPWPYNRQQQKGRATPFHCGFEESVLRQCDYCRQTFGKSLVLQLQNPTLEKSDADDKK